jgi:CelD/BcsL family acetyltransferase involved in cellulose biosynthesis
MSGQLEKVAGSGTNEMSSHEPVVRQLSWDELRSRRPEYEALLSRSAADPLFHSFDWLELWWLHFGRPADGERLVVLAVEQDGRLMAALPIIQHVVVERGPLKYRASTVLGNLPTGQRGVPTEYTTVTAEAGDERKALRLILKRWATSCSDREISIGWTKAQELWAESLRGSRTHAWEVVRALDPKEAYAVDLRNGFKSYTAALSGNARRSMFNLRRKLETSAGLSFRSVDPTEALASLDRMNALHALRWKKPAFGDSLEFHRELIGRLRHGCEVKFSELLVRENVVSVLYDIRRNGRQYNIQMGFDPEAFPNTSLGIIHLGYAIEEAACSGVEYYDFLGGEGMMSDYKRRYANVPVRLYTVQHLRGPTLNLALVASEATRWLRRHTTSGGRDGEYAAPPSS